MSEKPCATWKVPVTVCLRVLILAGVFSTLLLGFGRCTHAEALPAWPVVHRGTVDETNARVAMIQSLLRSHGYQVSVDGSYGTQTQKQVRQFQKAQHLPVTGIVSEPTWRKLIVPLNLGSRGAAVTAAQIPLKEMADLHLALDGRFDGQMKRAVQTFQRQYHLKTDGIVGPSTWRCLTVEISD